MAPHPAGPAYTALPCVLLPNSLTLLPLLPCSGVGVLVGIMQAFFNATARMSVRALRQASSGVPSVHRVATHACCWSRSARRLHMWCGQQQHHRQPRATWQQPAALSLSLLHRACRLVTLAAASLRRHSTDWPPGCRLVLGCAVLEARSPWPQSYSGRAPSAVWGQVRLRGSFGWPAVSRRTSSQLYRKTPPRPPPPCAQKPRDLVMA